MAGKTIRAAIVGASSLLGKELAEELNQSASLNWNVTLLDTGSDGAQLTSSGDEATVIQPLEPGAFSGMDLVFFAADVQNTTEHWRAASQAGASIVDVTGALEGQPGVVVRSPWIKSSGSNAASPVLDLATVAVVSAHPAAVMLGLVLSRLQDQLTNLRAAATVLQPASQAGSAGLDEMHSQTVSLLSFQSVPKDTFDAQVAFNLNVALGGAAKVDLEVTSLKIKQHLQLIAGSEIATNCGLNLVQAPVFNGYTASVFVWTDSVVEASALERLLDGGLVGIPAGDEAPPSNQSATEEGKLLIQVRSEPNGAGQENAFWLWMATDNIRLAARNAIACATELSALRPDGRVQ